MKVVVLNFTGNAGKTTISHHMLVPRLNNAHLVNVESINATESDATAKVRGRDFRHVHEFSGTVDDIVIDVGASNAEDFLRLMDDYYGSHEDFDFFIVPVTPDQKQLHDTITTLDVLRKAGIDKTKIRVIFNMVEKGSDVSRQFVALDEFNKKFGAFTPTPGAVIFFNDIFAQIHRTGDTVHKLASDPTDYKELITDSKPGSDERQQYAAALSLKRLAQGIEKQFDAAFAALNLN